MKAIYPFVGGSAASHKWNLKDPRDLNAAYRLTFTTGWVHSSTGAKANGTSDYANTFFIPLSSGSQNNMSIGVYNRNNVDGTKASIGGENAGYVNFCFIIPRMSNLYYSAINTNSNGNVPNLDSTGFYLASRLTSSSFFSQKNNSQTTFSNNSNTPSSFSLYLSAINLAGTGVYYSDNELSFGFIGDGLTSTEATNLYNAVQAYQTALGRQV